MAIVRGNNGGNNSLVANMNWNHNNISTGSGILLVFTNEMFTPEITAATYAGIYGDHLVTINSPSRCRDVIFPLFEAAARKSGKDPSKMEKMVEMGMSHVSPSQSRSKSVFSDIINETDPREIEEMRQRVSDSTLTRLDPSPDDITEALDSYWKVGATHVEIDTNSFPERIRFLGEKVLPYFLERRDDYSR